MVTCEPGTFTATTSGSEPTILYLIYSGPTGGGSKNMSKSGGAWTASLQIPDPGDYSWRVSTSITTRRASMRGSQRICW